MSRKDKLFIFEALKLFCMSDGKLKDFTQSARILYGLGLPQHAAFLEDRRDFFKKIKPTDFREIAKRRNGPFKATIRKSDPGTCRK
jgi:hypothetical protein